jgi:hypothetical protein
MSETLQEKNKAVLIEEFEVLFNKRDFAEADKFWGAGEIQRQRERHEA